MPTNEFEIVWDNHRLCLGPKTLVMGILNVTPDSFSDGGKFFSYESALAQAEQMVAEGADIIDVGGESTRPYSDPISAEEEIRRVTPVIRTIAERISIPISIDTTKARVAHAAIAAGATMVNDISALGGDPEMSGVVADLGVPLIVMHMKGKPRDMQVAPIYHDLIGEIRHFLDQAICRAEKHGIPKSKIIIDPGIGFGKTFGQNLSILKHLRAFEILGVPIMIGSSRKAFIRHLLRAADEKEPLPDSDIVETGTQATISAAVLNGAHIVRCHAVARARATLKVIDAINSI